MINLPSVIGAVPLFIKDEWLVVSIVVRVVARTAGSPILSMTLAFPRA